tara:strand:+ start:41823 stop:42800 length:978 start_codon:yes stop_codon:yes gene_type:complete
MHTRSLGNTGHALSEIGLGCWQLGGADWGNLSDERAHQILAAAVDAGVTFIDTADVYGAGRSEQLIGEFIRNRNEKLFVATKVGRRNYPGPYTLQGLREHIQESRSRLGVPSIDLVQLHCVPSDVMKDGEIFDFLRTLREEGLIKHFGASVESVDEALSIIDQPDLTSLQIIFNIFRQKPIDALLDAAIKRNVGVIVRLPLASGLLAGKFTRETTFDETDHRHYNKDGDAFNVGETFAGLPFAKGVELADQIKNFVPAEMTMAQFAQRWILDHQAVSTVITGASSPEQTRDNAAVSDLPPLSTETHQALRAFYQSSVHDHVRGVY